MTRSFQSLFMTVFALGCLRLSALPAVAQERQIEPGKTIIDVEILTPRQGGGILAPQQWGQAFDRLGQSVQIRQALEGDKPGVTEQVRGTLRFVKVVGALDRDGKLLVGDKFYTLNETARLKNWLDELKVYGAQGSPDGQPLWGLSRDQFTTLFGALSSPVESFQYNGQLLKEISSLPVPGELPVKLHHSLEGSDLDATPPAGEVSLTGLTTGTALAALLSQHGLGFRPLRTPDGSIELVVQKLDEIETPWPIGWDTPKEKSPGEVLPNLFRVDPLVGLDPQSLDSALGVISENVPVPVVVDYRRCLASGIDPKKQTVKYTYKQTAWVIALKTILRENRLNYTMRNDERGQTFLYVHPFEKTTVVPR